MNTIIKKYNLFLLLFALSALQFSCTPESCLEETNSFVKATFYTNDGTGIIKPPAKLTIYGIGIENSLLYDKAVNTSSILLPLDPSTESCNFIFIINDVSDTVTLQYSSYPHFISKECGYTYFYKLNDESHSTDNKIKDLRIMNYSVLIPNEENIKIFY